MTNEPTDARDQHQIDTDTTISFVLIFYFSIYFCYKLFWVLWSCMARQGKSESNACTCIMIL